MMKQAPKTEQGASRSALKPERSKIEERFTVPGKDQQIQAGLCGPLCSINLVDLPLQSKPENNRTGMPDQLKAGKEIAVDGFLQAKGFAMDNSDHSIFPSSVPSGIVLQRVGGQKFGLEALGDRQDKDVDDGINRIKQVLQSYKTEVKATKENAIREFDAARLINPDDIQSQTNYTQKLRQAEMTKEGLIRRLGCDFALAANGVISYKRKKVAQVREGNSAYIQSPGTVAPGYSPVYKRITLDGLGAKEYVKIDNAMVRRFAFRGITPAERLSYRTGKDLTPLNRGKETTGQMGFNFDPQTGRAKERSRSQLQEGQQRPPEDDLEWLSHHADQNVTNVPDISPRLLAFLQTRKGVGKALSATSTPRPITSNHGKAFTGFGNITIDLARVPIANFMHHYKAPNFTRPEISASIGGTGPGDTLDWEVGRANETVTRNRELVLSSIPHAAVTHLEDTNDRKAYEARFREIYIPRFNSSYLNCLAQYGVHGEVPPEIEPAEIERDYIEDHFTREQADADEQIINRKADSAAQYRARLRAQDRETKRREFRDSYIRMYEEGWTKEYENAAYEILAQQNKSDYVDVPNAPEPDTIPEGEGKENGSQQGWDDGAVKGRIAAGLAYNPAPQEEKSNGGGAADSKKGRKRGKKSRVDQS